MKGLLSRFYEEKAMRHSELNFGPCEVSVEKRADGSLVLRSPGPRNASVGLRLW